MQKKQMQAREEQKGELNNKNKKKANVPYSCGKL